MDVWTDIWDPLMLLGRLGGVDLKICTLRQDNVSTILLTDNNIFTVVTPKKPKESPTPCNCSNQKERHRDKTIAHTVSIQTVSDGISRRVTSDRDTCLSQSQG